MKFAVAWLLLQPFQLLALSMDQNQTTIGHTVRLGRIQLHQGAAVPLPPLGAAVASAAGTKPTWKGGTLATRMDVIVRSFCVVAVAEIFDKTWFVALICALNYGKKISFIGGFLALALHVFLAAALGVAISQFFSIRALCYSTAAVFFLLATAYLVEFLSSDTSDDVIAERSSEAKESMKGEKDSNAWSDALGRVFLAVFVAEWGDRTQVAMITLHSSAPWLPVCLGSLVAFLILTLSAVAAATLTPG
eukprot:s2301_g1.t1